MLTALAYEPKQASVLFETDRMRFDWQREGGFAAVCRPNAKRFITEYLRADAAGKAEPTPQGRTAAQKFDATA